LRGNDGCFHLSGYTVALQPGLFTIRPFHRDVRLILAVSGLMAISFFGVQNLVKVLYVLRLGYGLEYIGLFNATGALAYMAMSLPSGAIGSRFGAQPAMRLGGLITVLGMALLPLTELTTGWLRLALPILSQAVLVAGWSLCGINMAPALMALTTPQIRNNAFALNSVFRGVGTFVGAIIGGFLPGLFVLLLGVSLDDPAPYRWSLWVAAALGLVALLPLIGLGRIENRISATTGEEAGGFPIGWVTLLVIYAYFTHGAFATCQAFCNAYMDTDLRLSPAAIGLITGAGQFVAMLAPLLVPGLALRYSNRWTLTATSLGMAVSLLPLVLWSNWLAVGVGRLGMVALDAMWQPALQVVQMETVASRWRALAYGICSMMLGLTFASVSLTGGYIIATWGYRSLFLLGLIASLVGAALMRGVGQRQASLVSPQES
jgi:MFS family permease